MKIINIVDNIDRVNFGIWNAAISTSTMLEQKYGCKSELWFPKNNEMPAVEEFGAAIPVALESTNLSYLDKLIKLKSLNNQSTIIATHGVWRYPTIWGAKFKKYGFSWIYTPHGMLEPYGMATKAVKKKFYYTLRERPLARMANIVRAVSSMERKNLMKDFPNSTILIPNGTNVCSFCEKDSKKPVEMLYLGRLNRKKCVCELASAWKMSTLNNDFYPNFHLTIAGPNDGELSKLSEIVKDCKSITLIARSVVGQEKEKLLNDATYFILPSKSEGFPTSVVEAGMHGCIPIITDGCNFPELFDAKLGIKTICNTNSIKSTLNMIPEFSVGWNIDSMQKRMRQFFEDNYSLEVVADMQFREFSRLISVSK